jgi:hypothetical protein
MIFRVLTRQFNCICSLTREIRTVNNREARCVTITGLATARPLNLRHHRPGWSGTASQWFSHQVIKRGPSTSQHRQDVELEGLRFMPYLLKRCPV